MTTPVHEQLLDQVRAAFADGATPEAKKAAADACRMMLAVLDPSARAAFTAPASAPIPAAPTTANPLGVFLDNIVAKYGHLVPEETRSTLRNDIPMVPLPSAARR